MDANQTNRTSSENIRVDSRDSRARISSFCSCLIFKVFLGLATASPSGRRRVWKMGFGFSIAVAVLKRSNMEPQ